MSPLTLASVPRQAWQIKKPAVRHPGRSPVARAPPGSGPSLTRIRQRTFPFQEIKHT